MAQRKPKADARAATITVTFASGVTGGEAKIGTAVTITTSVAAATLTEVDWGDGTTDTSTTHTYSAAAAGLTVDVTDGTDTGASPTFSVVAADTPAGDEPAWGAPVSRQASQSTYATTTTPPDGPLTVQTLSKPGPG